MQLKQLKKKLTLSCGIILEDSLFLQYLLLFGAITLLHHDFIREVLEPSQPFVVVLCKRQRRRLVLRCVSSLLLSRSRVFASLRTRHKGSSVKHVLRIICCVIPYWRARMPAYLGRVSNWGEKCVEAL